MREKLTDDQVAAFRRNRPAVRASLACEGIYLTEDEETLFEEMDRDRRRNDVGGKASHGADRVGRLTAVRTAAVDHDSRRLPRDGRDVNGCLDRNDVKVPRPARDKNLICDAAGGHARPFDGHLTAMVWNPTPSRPPTSALPFVLALVSCPAQRRHLLGHHVLESPQAGRQTQLFKAVLKGLGNQFARFVVVRRWRRGKGFLRVHILMPRGLPARWLTRPARVRRSR